MVLGDWFLRCSSHPKGNKMEQVISVLQEIIVKTMVLNHPSHTKIHISGILADLIFDNIIIHDTP
jgi:hypothetical protein